jgi:hypothetical protein
MAVVESRVVPSSPLSRELARSSERIAFCANIGSSELDASLSDLPSFKKLTAAKVARTTLQKIGRMARRQEKWGASLMVRERYEE